MNGRDNSGMQSPLPSLTFRSPCEIPLSRLHRETQQERRGEVKRQRPLVSRHNRSRITTRGRRRVGKNSPLRSIIHTRDGRCWFSFDLCCAAAATRVVVSCQSTTRARSSDRRMGGGGEILEETAVQYICRK